MTRKNRSGVSRHVQHITLVPRRPGGTSNFSLQSNKVTNKDIQTNKAHANKRLRTDLSGYGADASRRVSELRADSRTPGNAGPSHGGGNAAEDEYMDMQGIFSHESYQGLENAKQAMQADGVEDEGEALMHAIRDYMHLSGLGYKYHDTRTWRDRIDRSTKNWDQVLPEVTDAYIAWKYPLLDLSASRPAAGNDSAHPDPTGAPDRVSPRNVDGVNHDHSAGTEATAPASRSPEASPGADDVHMATPPDSPRDATYDFDIDIIDMVTLAASKHIRRDPTQTAPAALAASGYLATGPVEPTLAVSFTTLEYFRRIRARKSSYSVESFAKVLCDLYAIPYNRRFRTAISDCYDVYMAILRTVDQRVKAYLGRDTPNWRVKNACPACSFELEGEPELLWRRLICMDGNNSLKRIAKIGDREIADRREFTESDYYLLAEFVDRFKNEVKSRPKNTDAVDPDDSDDDAWTDEEDSADEEGGPADFAGADDLLRKCTQNWKSAARDEKKKMWGIFDETGVFACACRHGFILWVVDMVKSGELAKYALAIVAKALEVFGERVLIGYDIGCTFNGTILDSSLGPEFRKQGCRCCVNAFHGYSHSHKCQTINHPSVIKGAGLEDFEEMERVFGASNELAPITRYSSKYHRRLHIDRHYHQWDEDKYANIGTWLYNNYRQALQILDTEVPALNSWLLEKGLREADLERWQQEEAKYFATLGKITEADAVAVEYVVRLRELWDLENQCAESQSAFVTSIPEDYTPSAPRQRPATVRYQEDASRTRKRETQMRVLRERRDRTLSDVIGLELKMGLATRWQPSTPEFIETSRWITERDYRLALEQLQRLVVQRLFELQSMNLSHTAYKVRTQIARSLQSRSKAIRAAINKYNKAARALKPPRPALDWTKVSHYSFLEEFELLRDTRNDVQNKPWADSIARQMIKKSRKIARAREEIARCNIEVRRVHSHILVENADLDAAVVSSRAERNPISGALADYSLRRQRVNTRILGRIEQIYALKGFSGDPTPGRRKGAITALSPSDRTPSAAAARTEPQVGDDGLDDQDASVDEAVVVGNAMRVLDFAMNYI